MKNKLIMMVAALAVATGMVTAGVMMSDASPSQSSGQFIVTSPIPAGTYNLVPVAASPSVSPSPSRTSTPSPTASPTVSSVVWSCVRSSITQNCPVSGTYDSSINGGGNQAAYVIQDAWNDNSSLESQVLSANSMSQWQVTAKLASGNKAVLSYPDSQDTITDTSDQPVLFSDFSALTTSYTSALPSSPGATDDYEAAYDIWLGEGDSNYSQELMIWTDNHGQRPAGNDTGKAWTGPDGTIYEIWANSGNTTVTLVRQANANSGNVNLLSLVNWLQANGYLTTNGINQVDYGFELCSTSGVSETFSVTAYSLDATCASGKAC